MTLHLRFELLEKELYMLCKIKRYLNPSTLRKVRVAQNREASFRLMLDGMEVGQLDYVKGKWMYKYAEEYKESQGIKPLAGFPDVNKKYVSEELWPFFMSRIPSLSREKVKCQLHKEEIHENDLLQLLNRFGKRTITNPFVLVTNE